MLEVWASIPRWGNILILEITLVLTKKTNGFKGLFKDSKTVDIPRYKITKLTIVNNNIFQETKTIGNSQYQWTKKIF